MKKSKILKVMSTCLLAVAILVATALIFTPKAQAATVISGTCGDNLTWTLDDAGTLTITGTGAMYDYIEWENCAPWYSNRSSIKTIAIGDSVTTIGDYAFYDCDILTAVTIPDDVTHIGESSFSYCYNLTAVTISDSVTTIGNHAFYYCNSLTAVTIPDSVTSIGNSTFADCYNLTAVTIPDSVTSIGTNAFSDCDSLTYNTYDNANYLGNAENPFVALISATGTDIASCDIHPDAKAIAGDAFSACDSLSYNFYDNAKYLGTGENPFMALISATGTDIASCDIHPDTKMILDSAFDRCVNLAAVIIPDGVTSMGASAFEYCENLTAVTIPDSVMSIGASAFCGCYNLAAVTIPDGVKTINDFAFNGCYRLTAVTIGDSVTCIGDHAFSNCSGLTYVTIPDSVTTISDYAFFGCYNLAAVTIPDSVTGIGENAFADCGNLTGIWMDENNTAYASGQYGELLNEEKTTLLQVPGGIYGDYTTPNSATKIDEAAFYGCTRLISVTVGDSVRSIGAVAFAECYNLTAVTIGGSVTNIESETFRSCNRLTVVTIPASVTHIDDSAFDGCDSLQTIYYGGTRTQWNSISIGSDNGSLTNATVHYNHIHDYTLIPEFRVEPTCYDEGYVEYTCAYGETYRVILGALGHAVGDDAVVTPPTCTERGYTTSTCPRCGTVAETDIKSALGHNYSGTATVIDPTCTESGHTKTYCVRCDDYLTSCYMSALGHDYSGTVTVVDPTCTAQGYTKTSCIRCDRYVTSDYTDEVAHKMVLAPASDPTCEKPGLTRGTVCQWCGWVGVSQQETAPALGHSYVDHEAKAPTCAEVGWEAYQTCERCDYSTYAEQPALGHRVYMETTTVEDPLTMTNDVDIPFERIDGVYYSNNHADNSASELTITALYDCTLKLIYGVSSESDYDWLTICRNGSQVDQISGSCANLELTLTLTAGDVITLCYSKDVSQSRGDDCGWVRLVYENVEATGMGDVQIDALNPSCENLVTCTYCNTVFGHNFADGVCTDCGHKKVDVKITGVTLRPGCAGLYFKGSFAFDTDVAVSRYGIAVSLYNNLPVADDSDATSLYTVGENSVLISNILGEGKNGRDLIYARPYVLLDDGTYIYGDVVVTNLKSVVETIDAKFDGLSAAQKTAIADMYLQHTAAMQHWLIPKIKEFGEA